MKVIIDLYCWRPTARADALHFFKRKHSVRRGLLVADAKFVFAMFKKLIRTAQHAADVRAHLHVEFTRRFRPQHGVIADHVPYFELGESSLFGQMSNHFIADESNLILAVEEHRDEKGPGSRVLFHLLVEKFVELFGNHHKIAKIAKIG